MIHPKQKKESSMSKEIEQQIKLLTEKHKDLKLDLMEADAHWDEMEAQRIKKEKLRIKDEIYRLQKQQ